MSAVDSIPARDHWTALDASDITTPFGGMKQSGTGRDRSLHGFEQYTYLKTTWIDLR